MLELNTPDRHEYRIYGDDRAQTWVVLDCEDYQHFVRWRWHINKPHRNRNGKKQYFVRSQSNGRRWAPRLYLHVEIMKRAGIEPQSDLHTLVDHLDGDEFNCRRSNLAWATKLQNNRNRFGLATRQASLVPPTPSLPARA